MPDTPPNDPTAGLLAALAAGPDNPALARLVVDACLGAADAAALGRALDLSGPALLAEDRKSVV